MNDQKTILVVDDEDGMRITLRSAMESYGFSVLDADNGQEALRIAKETPPDIVLCDIEMPEINGFELLQMFRDHEPIAAVPFIFLTGRTDRSYMRKGMTMGADDFITKPATAEEVFTAVSLRLKKVAEQEQRVEGKLGELREHITRSVPHELRTPLTGIIGFGQILQEQGQEMPPEDFREIVGQILESAENLQTTLEKFWYYSNIVLLSRNRSAVETLLQSKVSDVKSLIESVSQKSAEAGGRQTDLRLDIEAGCAVISEIHLTKIVGELVENGIKFSDPGSLLEVRGKAEGESRTYRISVSDRGRGMTREQTSAIGAFLQFEREKYEQQGLGLGLITAREIVGLYKGEFDVVSEEGKGTTVSLRLPLCP